MKNFTTIFIIARRMASMAAICLVAPSLLAQQSSPSVAGMSQDIDALQRTVGQLNARVEKLEKDNADLQKQLMTERAVKAIADNELSATKADLNDQIKQSDTAMRKEFADEMTKQIDALTKEMNKAIAKAQGQAVAVTPVVTPGNTTAPATAPKFSDNFPKGGVPYTVKKGDSVASIAAKYKSKIPYILNANKIADPKSLREGQPLFIPQDNPDPPAAAPAGGN